jgi:hypothetical protein
MTSSAVHNLSPSKNPIFLSLLSNSGGYAEAILRHLILKFSININDNNNDNNNDNYSNWYASYASFITKMNNMNCLEFNWKGKNNKIFVKNDYLKMNVLPKENIEVDTDGNNSQKTQINDLKELFSNNVSALVEENDETKIIDLLFSYYKKFQNIKTETFLNGKSIDKEKQTDNIVKLIEEDVNFSVAVVNGFKHLHTLIQRINKYKDKNSDISKEKESSVNTKLGNENDDNLTANNLFFLFAKNFFLRNNNLNDFGEFFDEFIQNREFFPSLIKVFDQKLNNNNTSISSGNSSTVSLFKYPVVEIQACPMGCLVFLFVIFISQ